MLLLKSLRHSNYSIVCRGMSSGTSLNKKSADVVILGGGMVGSSLACAMAASPVFAGRKICLLEGAPKKPYNLTESYSNRVRPIVKLVFLYCFSQNMCIMVFDYISKLIHLL